MRSSQSSRQKRIYENFFFDQISNRDNLFFDLSAEPKQVDVEKINILINSITDKEGLSVLDIGCGNGYYSKKYLMNGCNVVGIDISKSGVVLSKKRLQNYKQGKFLIADTEKLPFKDKSFDIVSFMSILEHLDDPVSSVSELSRVLRPMGKIVVYTINSRDQMTPEFIMRLFFPKKYNKMLKSLGHSRDNFYTVEELKLLFEKYDIKIIKVRLIHVFLAYIYDHWIFNYLVHIGKKLIKIEEISFQEGETSTYSKKVEDSKVSKTVNVYNKIIYPFINGICIVDTIPRLFGQSTGIVALAIKPDNYPKTSLNSFKVFQVKGELSDSTNKGNAPEDIARSRLSYFNLAYQYTFSVWRKSLLIFLLLILFFLTYINSKILVFLGSLFLIDWAIHRLGMNERYRRDLLIRHQILGGGALSQDKRISGRDINQDNGTGIRENKIGAELAGYLMERKKILLQNIVSGLDASRVLDVGCGTTTDQVLTNTHKKNYIGTDIRSDYLNELRMKIDVDAVLCDAHRQPFKKDVFSMINLADVIEHLHDSALVLQELYEILEDDGGLIIIANNRSQFSVECFNPLIFIERALGIYMPSILPPQRLVDQWTGFTPFYHVDFSKKEIVKMMEHAGFKVEKCVTFNQLSWIIHLALLVRANNKNLTKVVFGLENLVMNIPVIKNMGHFMIVCKKL